MKCAKSTCVRVVDSRDHEAQMQKIDQIEKDIHRYEDILDQMKLGSDSDVMRFLQQQQKKEAEKVVTG
jgi:hypothetical protein